MRQAELLLVLVSLLAAVLAALQPAVFRASSRVIIVVLVAAAAGHFVAENLYWQVIPAYLASALLGVMLLTGERLTAPQTRLGGVLCVGLVAVSTLSLLIVPKFRLPQPGGPYKTGTTILHLVDPVRADAAFSSGKRELMVQAWYPTEQAEGRLASYRRRKEATLLSSYDAVLKTHSIEDASVAKRGAPFPLLLFNPSWTGQRTQNTFEMEELASQGFVVVAIDHTHNSMPVAFPDGQVLRQDNLRSIDDFRDATLEQQQQTGDAEARVEAADNSLVIDMLAAAAADARSRWYGAVETSRVGAFGHSFGGAASIQAAFDDPRIVAALNMDGWNFGDLRVRSLGKPLMFLYEDGYSAPAGTQGDSPEGKAAGTMDAQDIKSVERALAAGGGWQVYIAGSKHMNFSDRALYSPLRQLTHAGAIRPERAHEIITRYTLAFFSHVLRGTTEPLLEDGPSPYPEVRVKYWPRH